MGYLGRYGAALALVAVLSGGCSGSSPLDEAAAAICDAVHAEPSDLAAFEGFERDVARERREGLDEEDLLAAVEEQCGRAIAAITAAASVYSLDPEPETQAEPKPEVVEEPDVVFADLRPIDWVHQMWTTDCTEDGVTRGLQLTLEDGQGVHRPPEPTLTPIYVVDLDDVVYGDVTGDGHDDVVFVTQCVFASAEYFVEVWSHDEEGQPLHLPIVNHFSKFEAVVDRVEAVDGLLRVHSREGAPGDDMPHLNGYPIEVVWSYTFDGNTWDAQEISRTDTRPEPESDPTSQSAGTRLNGFSGQVRAPGPIGCVDPVGAPDGVGYCFSLALLAEDEQEARRFATDDLVDSMVASGQLSASFWGLAPPLEFGCGPPVIPMSDPTATSCIVATLDGVGLQLEVAGSAVTSFGSYSG